MLFRDATDEPCERCLALAVAHRIDYEAVLPMPKFPPRGHDGKPCCRDCAAADTLIKLRAHPDWDACRLCVGNDRQEQFRMPGAPLGLALNGIIERNAAGDLDRHIEWLERRVTPLIPAATETAD